MADQIITERPIKQQSGFNLNSYLLGLDADSYRILISDLAKKIVEDYSGSTLAGSAQAVKTALDSIDSTIGNTAMGTTATTITGAIAEHESDISTLNSKSSRINTASNTVNGLTVNLYYLESAPNIMLLKITGTTTNEMSVASGYTNLWNANTFITAACGTRSASIIKYIQSAQYNIQLYVEAGGLIKIGYVRSLADYTAANIPARTSFYIEELLFFK